MHGLLPSPRGGGQGLNRFFQRGEWSAIWCRIRVWQVPLQFWPTRIYERQEVDRFLNIV
jgi:hypothetical protein